MGTQNSRHSEANQTWRTAGLGPMQLGVRVGCSSEVKESAKSWNVEARSPA